MNTFKTILVAVLAVVLAVPISWLAMPPAAHGQSGQASLEVGLRDAFDYNFTPVRIFSGPIAAASPAVFQLSGAQVKLGDGRTIVPWFVGQHVRIGTGSVQETVVLTAVSGCYNGAPQGNCTISGNTVNAHGQGDLVSSQTFGAEEAMYDAYLAGGGQVAVGSYWAQAGGTTAMLAAAQAFYNVSFADFTNGPVQYWNPIGGLTTLAVPATLTAVTALPSTTPVGTFTATAYNMCIAYVDILGQEGPCSTSFVNTGAGATSSFVFSAPAASTGAVGYTIYIGLTGAGSTTLQYKVPLVTQPTVVGTYPAANGVCTLTAVETTTPACAVTNTSYGQTGSTATVSAITVNTSPIQPLSTVVSTTSVFVPNAGGRTTYTYAPSSHIGAQGLPASWLPFTISAADATTVPSVIGTINLRPNFMNVLGKTLEICGEATTTASTATIVNIAFQWDSMGQNTAGAGVQIGNLTATPAAAIATAGHATFCQDFQTTATGATATGGSINHVNGFGSVGGVTLIAPGALSDAVTPGTVASLNLAADARINVIYLHTTGTDGAAWTLQHLEAHLK